MLSETRGLITDIKYRQSRPLYWRTGEGQWEKEDAPPLPPVWRWKQKRLLASFFPKLELRPSQVLRSGRTAWELGWVKGV